MRSSTRGRVYEPLRKHGRATARIQSRYWQKRAEGWHGTRFQDLRGMAHTNGVESFWSMLKRGYQGTHHHMSAKHLDRYVTEFEGRHNIRENDTGNQMAHVAKQMVGRRLKYQDLAA